MRSKKENPVSDSKEHEELLHVQIRQQEAVAELGLLALSGTDLRTVLNEAVQKLQKVLNVEYTKVLELLPGGKEVVLRAGKGWNKDIVIDKSIVDTGKNSQAGYTLSSKKPVIVKDLSTEKRFNGPPLLVHHHVVSGMSCIIWGKNNKPYGVLGIHTTKRRDFTSNDVTFLQAMANTLAAAIQRKQDEDRLLESELRKSAILESSRDAIITIDQQDRIVDWNAAAERLFGFSREQAIGKEMSGLIIPERLRGAHHTGMEHYLATGEGPVLGQLLEVPALRADGTEFLSELTIAHTQSKGPTIFSATMRDITERKHAEEALRESEERFRATFDEAALAMSITDLKGKWITHNQVYQKIFGYSTDELKNLDFMQITHPDDRERDVQKMMKLVTGEISTLNLEKRYLHKDGSVIWGVVHLSTIKDADGKPKSIIAAIQDITERKKAEEALKKSEEKFRMLADNIPNLCWMANADGWIYWFNSRWYEYTGTSPEKVMGWGWQSVHDPEALPQVLEKWKESIASGEKFEMVFPLKGADGTFRPFLTRVMPVRDEQGKVLQWFGTNTDITKIREVEEKLQYQKSLLETQQEVSPLGILVVSQEGNMIAYNQLFMEMWNFSSEISEREVDDLALQAAKEQLVDPEEFVNKVREVYQTRAKSQEKLFFKDGRIFERYGSPVKSEDGVYYGYVWFFQDITEQENLARQKDDFIGIASHELKTPVTSIKAYTQILQNRFRTSEDRVSSDMLAKMDIQLDKLTNLVTDLLDVTKIEQGQLQLRQETFEFNGLVRDIANEIQSTTQHKQTIIQELAQDKMVHGDRDRIGQVITNLLTNAIKYSQGTDKVIVRSEIKNKELIFAVQDFGIGLSEKDQEKVFERFYRTSDLKSETYPGLGLGLYISSVIVNRHNGNIWVESKKGEGSIFYFSLPYEA